MQRVVHHSSLSATEMDASPTLHVLIAYQDFENGKQAKKVYDFLVEQLGHDFRFTNQMWRFDVLGVPTLREMAAKDAAQADIMIIACRGTELPMEVKAWTELWLSYESQPIALVALFDAGENEARNQSGRDYLASVAQRAQIEFFAQPEDSEEGGKGSRLLFGRPLDTASLDTLASVRGDDLSFPRWGINE